MIGTIGGRYLVVVVLWAGAALIYMLGMRESIAKAMNLVAIFGKVRVNLPIGMSVTLVAVGVYLLHMFSWMLGGLYRSCHKDFPWAFQRHISTRKVERRPVRHGRRIPMEAKDKGVLVPQVPPPQIPPKLRAKPLQE